MNLIWHVIKKDLRRFRLPISIWALAGVIVITMNVNHVWTTPFNGSTGQEIATVTSAAFFLLTVALLGWIVQEDSLATPGAFWQSRPLSGRQLLSAKALLVFVLLAFLPSLLTHACSGWIQGNLISELVFKAFAMELFSLTAIMLYGMAIAAATRDNGSFVLGAIVATGSFLAPTVVNMMLYHLSVPTASAAFTKTAVIGVGGAAALLNQYLRRRTRLTFVILGATIIASTLIRQLWTLPLPPLHR